MSLQLGDWVRVIGGGYTITTEGSIGVVESCLSHGEYVEVDFKEYGPTTPSEYSLEEFGISLKYLEKIAPPAHLVGVGPIVIPPQETTRPKTQEEKLEIFSRKIDSEEKLSECLVEIGASKDTLGLSWWMVRDNIRCNYAYFKRIPSYHGPVNVPQDAYLHLSKCGTKVAFVENEDKQKRDIWTVMGYGRYLTKYHPELDNEQVKMAVNTFNYDHGAAPEVFFGESQDEFIRAINEGPSESCMHGLDFAGHIHPAAVYAAGDIKVAWIERDGRITARTLINKGTKKFSRVYGDHAKLKPLLEAMGYESQVGALAGCRLLMIDNEDGNGYIMPYVDAGTGTGGGALRFHEDGQTGFFMLSDAKGISTCVGNDNGGVTDPQGCQCTCDDCGCDCDEDDLNYTWYETSVCNDCLNNEYENALVSRRCHEWVRNDRCVWVECMSEWVHESYLGDLDVVRDDFSSEYIKPDDAVRTLSDQWAHANDCVECGTDKYGSTIWIHEVEVSIAAHGELYKRGKDYFWHESVEIIDWLESAGEEDHDPDEFVLVEVKAEPAALKVEATPETPSPIKVGDMVRVLHAEGHGTTGHVGKVLSVGGFDAVVEEPGGCVISSCGGKGWYRRFEKLQIVQKVQPNQEIKTRQAAYLRMQERGIKFSNGGQHPYKIDPAQTPPVDWQEIYEEAQDSGVVFEYGGTGFWRCDWMFFDSPFNKYRLEEIA